MHFDEGAQIAIAQGISHILNTSKIDAKLLAEENLEPDRLLAYLRDLHPNRTKNFSKEETEFSEGYFQRFVKTY